MFRLALLCMAVALSSAYEFHAEHCCTIEDRKEVLALWQSVWNAEYTGRRIALTQAVFTEFFIHAPDAKLAFERVHPENVSGVPFTAHALRVTNGFDTILNLLFDPRSLEEQLHHLSEAHSHYPNIKKEHFKIMREAFAVVLPQAVPCFNVAAWLRCMTEMQDWITEKLPDM